MARRYTWPNEDQPRKLPRNGRTRNAVRLAYIEQVVDPDTNQPVYAQIVADDGEGNTIIKQKRACRKVRRREAFVTRLRNDGKPWGTMPRNIETYQELIRMALKVSN